jgi:hypothetical protein
MPEYRDPNAPASYFQVNAIRRETGISLAGLGVTMGQVGPIFDLLEEQAAAEARELALALGGKITRGLPGLDEVLAAFSLGRWHLRLPYSLAWPGKGTRLRAVLLDPYTLIIRIVRKGASTPDSDDFDLDVSDEQFDAALAAADAAREAADAEAARIADEGVLRNMLRLCLRISPRAGLPAQGRDGYEDVFPRGLVQLFDEHPGVAIGAVRGGRFPVPRNLVQFVTRFLGTVEVTETRRFDRMLLAAIAGGIDLEVVRAGFPDVDGDTDDHVERIMQAMRVDSPVAAAVLAIWAGWIKLPASAACPWLVVRPRSLGADNEIGISFWTIS